jgi:acid phosphatase type 7
MHRFRRASVPRLSRVALLTSVLVVALLGARGVTNSLAGASDATAPHWSLPRPNRVIAVGDASCWPIQRTDRTCRMDEVAPLAERADLLLLLGDIAQNHGTVDEYAKGFDPTWGHLVGRAFPVAGNHDYEAPGAEPYYAYFGERAGEPGRGFYSVDLSGWRIYGLNSNCWAVGCGPDSPQWRWLRSALRTDPGCSLAMFHHPFRSSVDFFEPSQAADVEPLYQLLIDARVPLVLTGHAHLYERVAIGGRTEQITAGTGGYGFHPLAADGRIAGSQAAIEGVFGVLELRLEDRSYTTAFLPIDGGRRDVHTRPCGPDEAGPTAS